MKNKKRRERIASKNSQFDPKIHQLGKQGFGFQMKNLGKCLTILEVKNIQS